ncbi:putative integrase [Pseudomonas brassicacearum subsp. brassicacearum NFM421]|uniref:Putative integrase n=1 Tax=Pseudomonas brassicacearum (strain NFM421) TaxID=994484 RepID=F2KF39_PSEBN|nr:integrase arm-type DNA-binding domain-containing protein [Pseudomonas ogarae]AEA68345.1 putative integrase [Pseudomonas brassicacearum subsp. brassicacearum NFM421]
MNIRWASFWLQSRTQERSSGRGGNKGRLNKRALRDARALRDIARALVAKGIDPRDQRRLERNAKLLNLQNTS